MATRRKRKPKVYRSKPRTRAHRGLTPKSPAARAMARNQRIVRTGRRSFLERPEGEVRITRSTGVEGGLDFGGWASEELVAADAAMERGESPREALGVRHRRARPKLDAFTRQYAETALWSTNDESTESGGHPLDRNYDVSDIATETLAEMADDCRKFQRDNAEDLLDADEEDAGHRFWLARNGHGVSFSDDEDDYPEGGAERLDAAADEYGEVNLYVHNGKVYSS